jgi:peptide/nickel transport system permease protein
MMRKATAPELPQPAEPRGGIAARLRTSPIARTLARRILLGAITLFLVSVIVFAATQVLPGDAARAVLGRTATPARLVALRLLLHLDRPAVSQYWIWLTGLLSGRPGTSLANGEPVWSLVEPRVLNSLFLLTVVAVVGVPLSLALGIVAALRRDRWFDHVSSTVSLAAAALPEFVIAVGLVILLATVVFHVLPPVSLVPPGTHVWSNPRNIVLPALTLMIAIVPYIYRMMRGSMIEALESEYVEMAKLKGVSQRSLLLLHAFPNAVAPTVQAVALTFAYLAGGVVVVEYVFGFPGIGQGLVNAVNARDIPVIQFTVVLLAGFYVVVNILADLIAVLVTPRLRTGSWRRS